MAAITEAILKIKKLILTTFENQTTVEDNGSAVVFTTDSAYYQFDKPVKGSNAVNADEFVTKSQFDSVTQSSILYYEYTGLTDEQTFAGLIQDGWAAESVVIIPDNIAQDFTGLNIYVDGYNVAGTAYQANARHYIFCSTANIAVTNGNNKIINNMAEYIIDGTDGDVVITPTSTFDYSVVFILKRRF